MHEGHRQRMLEKFKEAETGLPDHELLEILLYYAIPRKNTNEIAHSLLDAFGSVKGVLTAEREQLIAVDGVGESTAAFLRLLGVFFGKVEQDRREIPSAYNFEQFLGYLKGRFENADREYVEFYALDGGHRVKFRTRFTSGEEDCARVPPDEIARFFVASRPKAVIVVHNHLCKCSEPSRADDLFTEQVQMYCAMHNVRLFDHVIVSPAGMYSYHTHDRLEEIRNTYNVNIFGATVKR